MKTPARLILVRHAESERNKALDGSLFLKDPSLLESIGKIPDHKINITEKGIDQALKTSRGIHETVGTPDVVFHSGYMRTRQTTEGILSEFKNHSITIKENLALRERESGYTHTILESDNEKFFPYLQNYWNVVGGIFARPIGGESLIDVMENRLKPFLEELNTHYAGKTVVLVTHGRVIQCFRFILDMMTWEEMENFLDQKESIPKNCSVTTYVHNTETDALKLESWNRVWWE